MENLPKKQFSKISIFFSIIFILGVILLIYFFSEHKVSTNEISSKISPIQTPIEQVKPTLNLELYKTKLFKNANLPSSTSSLASLWPVQTTPPNYGALLPFNRIVAYYGNLYSKNMGVLGEYPEEIMLEKLNSEVLKWQLADPETPVIPALHYIAVVAQAGAGKDGKFRARMPTSEIDKVLAMAEKINALVFLDIQVGLSNIENELPYFEKYLKLPNVHLGIDPEFYMKNGTAPGLAIGSMDARDVNFAANYLAKIVQKNNLAPKILIIHRFTKPMLTNYNKITPLSEVQIVLDMDGFGSQASKLNTYTQYIQKEPVQFTGFKLFYKNDNESNNSILTPEQLLKLTPTPLYIQFQ